MATAGLNLNFVQLILMMHLLAVIMVSFLMSILMHTPRPIPGMELVLSKKQMEELLLMKMMTAIVRVWDQILPLHNVLIVKILTVLISLLIALMDKGVPSLMEMLIAI